MWSERSKCDSPAPSEKMITRSSECKLNIIDDFDNGIKICELAKKFELPESAERTTIKNDERILDRAKNARSSNSSGIGKRAGMMAEMETMPKLWRDN